MRNDGYDSDTAVSRRRRRRREICRSFTCVSPWSIFWRWFNGGRSRVSRNVFVERNWGKEKMEGDFDLPRKSGIVSSSSRRDVSETGKEPSFNIGVGIGLIYLVRTELNKMVELRKRIEMLLQNFHADIENQDKKQPYIPSRSSVASSLSKTHVQEILYDDEHDSSQLLSSNEAKRSFGSSRFRREKSLRMDQLEAELEAEFDRLHHHSFDDGDVYSNYSQEQNPEANMEDNAPEFLEEISDQLHEYYDSEFYGVSPRDLESKLHEVLEAQQQERIDELESALDYAMQQLEERERELSCWKDSARLISHHLPFIPGLLRQVKQAMEAEFEVREMGKSLRRNCIYECDGEAI